MITNGLTSDLIKQWIINLGHRPACPEIDLSDILVDVRLRDIKWIEFYVNPHNLCWYASTSWKNSNRDISTNYKFRVNEFESQIRSVIRGNKLEQLLSD